MRYLGIKDSRICLVSNAKILDKGYHVVEFSNDSISSEDLMMNYKFQDNQIINKNVNKEISEMKFAFIGNWKMKCGISTYSEKLLPHILPAFKDVRLFIEENDFITGNIYEAGDFKLTENQVITCWKRGESLKKLIKEIKDYNPDIILIQHEFGLWHNAAYWLSFMNQISEYKNFTTMHSVFYHKDKTICEAAMPRIIVHLDGAKKVLKEIKKVSGEVTVIPHGFDDVSKEKLWNFYKTDKTFMQFGFGFRYKGWENALKATHILKQKYKDIFFTGLFSESPYNKNNHQLYYEELMRLVKDLDIEENVAIIRGYQSDECIESYLKTNSATVFPYTSTPEHEVFGASGAARMAMSKGVAVITSDVNHFSDLPSIKANTPEEIAEKLSFLFDSKKDKQNQIDKQFDFALNNSWRECASKYLELFKY